MFKTTASVTGEQTEAARNQRWSAWIQRMGKGDIDALGALYDESSTIIFGLVVQILSDRQLAEDTLVDIYKLAREQARKFDCRRQTALDWLITLARNLAVDRQSRSGLSRPIETVEDSFHHERHLADFAVAQLTVEQRSILEMTYWGGLTADEVADLLGVSRAYVAKQIVSAMRTLKAFSRNVSGTTVGKQNETRCESPTSRTLVGEFW